MKSKTTFEVVSIWILIVGAFGVCEANTINTPLVPFSTTGTTFVNIAFQQFDPSLGTLTLVTLKGLNIGQTMTVEVANMGPGAVSESATFQLALQEDGLPNFITVLLDQTIKTASCSASALEFNSCDTIIPVSDLGHTASLIELNGSNAPYIGAGTVPAMIKVFQQIFPITDTPSGGTRVYDSSASSGNLYLEYTYTPAVLPTPEPKTVWVCCAGLALIGGLKAGRRSQSKPCETKG